jgi:hypothetical protein
MFYNCSAAQAQEGSHDFISCLGWLNCSIWRAYFYMSSSGQLYRGHVVRKYYEFPNMAFRTPEFLSCLPPQGHESPPGISGLSQRGFYDPGGFCTPTFLQFG